MEVAPPRYKLLTQCNSVYALPQALSVIHCLHQGHKGHYRHHKSNGNSARILTLPISARMERGGGAEFTLSAPFCHKNNKEHHFVRKHAITAFLSRKLMLTRFSIAFEDLLASSIAPQVLSP